MKLVRDRTDYRVEVYPMIPFYRQATHQEMTTAIEDMARVVRRHVDGIDQVVATWDTTICCPFCHFEWELDEEGIPLCCQRAIDNWTGKEE